MFLGVNFRARKVIIIMGNGNLFICGKLYRLFLEIHNLKKNNKKCKTNATRKCNKQNATTKYKCEKKRKQCKQKCKKACKQKMQKKMHNSRICIFFHRFCAFLGGPPVRASKVQNCKDARKRQKKMRRKNAKKLNNSRSCIFLHFCLRFSFYFFCSFLHFPGPRLLGLYFLGAFVCIFLQFNQLLQSLE